jgi:hypothetical protein
MRSMKPGPKDHRPPWARRVNTCHTTTQRCTELCTESKPGYLQASAHGEDTQDMCTSQRTGESRWARDWFIHSCSSRISLKGCDGKSGGG